MARIVGLVIALLILSAFFGLIERLWPSSTTQRRSKQSLITDLTWWGFTPLIGKFVAGVFVGVSILAMARLIGQNLTLDELKGLTERETFVSTLPLGVQLVMF